LAPENVLMTATEYIWMLSKSCLFPKICGDFSLPLKEYRLFAEEICQLD